MKTVIVDFGKFGGSGLLADKFKSLGIASEEASAGRFEEKLTGADFLTVLGGDGSVLAVSPAALAADIPVLCINHGTLGYLSRIERGELSLLDRLTSGIRTEDRMTIDADVNRKGQAIASFTALNEIVVSKGGVSRLVRLRLRCNGSEVGIYRADGLIVATPTGSTAYSLSAGGPIVDTGLDALTVCPVCPHSLSAQRALVFSPDSAIEIIPTEGNRSETVLTADGNAHLPLCEGDTVRIRRGSRRLRLVCLRDESFFDVLNRKLMQQGEK